MSYDDNRLDKRLADILHGDHPIQGDHQQKVVEIAELIELEHAVSAMGDHRHTGDWDWAATVETIEGEKFGDTIWYLDFKDRPDNFTACTDADKVEFIHIEGQNYNEATDEMEDVNADVPIRTITNIYWEER